MRAIETDLENEQVERKTAAHFMGSDSIDAGFLGLTPQALRFCLLGRHVAIKTATSRQTVCAADRVPT